MRFIAFTGAGLVVLLCGCGPSNELGRLPISGQVSLRGQPLEQGTVRFMPEDEAGVASGAIIRQGKYEIAEEKGLPPGAYRVILSSAGAAAATDTTAPPGESHAVAAELIPSTFNRQSNVVVEVTPEGDNKFDFAVP